MTVHVCCNDVIPVSVLHICNRVKVAYVHTYHLKSAVCSQANLPFHC